MADDKIDVYAVGLWRDLRQFRASGHRPRRVRRLARSLRYPFRQARARNWRAVRNYFNGYLAEPYTMPPGVTRCGRGWTRRGALKDWEREARRHG
jgi:hypothetical protein